jgi:hypothetical protein
MKRRFRSARGFVATDFQSALAEQDLFLSTDYGGQPRSSAGEEIQPQI